MIFQLQGKKCPTLGRMADPSVHFLEKGHSPSNVNLLDRKSIRLIDNIANCALTFGMK